MPRSCTRCCGGQCDGGLRRGGWRGIGGNCGGKLTNGSNQSRTGCGSTDETPVLRLLQRREFLDSADQGVHVVSFAQVYRQEDALIVVAGDDEVVGAVD